MNGKHVRRTWAVSLLVLSGLGMTLTGCPGFSPYSTLDESWNGGTYNLIYGSMVSVQLQTDDQQACQWRIAQLNPNFLSRVDNDVQSPGTRSQLADGRWVETFRFQGVNVGPTDLQLRYHCDGTPTEQTFSLHVNVVGSGI